MKKANADKEEKETIQVESSELEESSPLRPAWTFATNSNNAKVATSTQLHQTLKKQELATSIPKEKTEEMEMQMLTAM